MKIVVVMVLYICSATAAWIAARPSMPIRFSASDSAQEKLESESQGVKKAGEKSTGERPPESQRPITDVDLVPGKALKKVQPKYPKEAKKARVTGTVQVKVVVDEKGKVAKADAISGEPLLHQAAEKAALKWRFEPTLLFGKPVKVSALLTFNFILE